eukprot:Hpha_TRINITY_DN34226_c0_g1::TRINITY_DN34226_c0_g1_i1::g.34480::m.34480
MTTMLEGARGLLRVAAWPGILLHFVWMWHGCRVSGYSEIYALATSYGMSLVLTAVLERVLPFREEWNATEGDRRVDTMPVVQDLAHTTLTALSVEGTKAICERLFLHHSLPFFAPALRQLPLAVEVALGLVVFEFGGYWQHRLSHTCSFLWPFHAVHHCVPRLHALNTGRFHWLNQVRATVFGFPLLFLGGFSEDAIYEITGLLAVLGMLSHCNVDMRCGVLNYVFNTPQQHRWHHSTRLNESNSNFGENLMIFDHVFGTFFDGHLVRDSSGSKRRKTCPEAVGRARYCDGRDQPCLVRLPKGFLGQLSAPFTHNPLAASFQTPTLRQRLAKVWHVIGVQNPGPSNPYHQSYLAEQQ